MRMDAQWGVQECDAQECVRMHNDAQGSTGVHRVRRGAEGCTRVHKGDRNAQWCTWVHRDAQ